MLQPGLVSVTFRALSPAQIIDLCARNDLKGLEWGGDIHVPPGDLRVAREVRQRTHDAGLTVACYGSYYRCDGGNFSAVLDTALELGAPVVRVWAGAVDASAATAENWAATLADFERILPQAREAGVQVATEFHSGTLTADGENARRLLDLMSECGLKTLWQPLQRGHNFAPCIEENLAELEAVAPFLAHVHVYEWAQNPDGEREALSLDVSQQWPHYIEKIRALGAPRWFLLEFLPAATPECLAREAKALHSLLKTPAAR